MESANIAEKLAIKAEAARKQLQRQHIDTAIAGCITLATEKADFGRFDCVYLTSLLPNALDKNNVAEVKESIINDLKKVGFDVQVYGEEVRETDNNYLGYRVIGERIKIFCSWRLKVSEQ